jgi:hypothetical protein
MSKEEGENITVFQFFALSYLYSEELKRTQKEQFIDDNIRMRTHHSQSSVTPSPIAVSVRELAVKSPTSMIKERLTSDQILEQLQILESNQLLELAGIGGYRGEYTKFSITTDGIMFLKSIYAQLSEAIKDKNVYEKIIDNVEGNSEAKTWLKGAWDKLKDKAQDEIADIILSGVRKYGTELIGIGFRLLNEYMKNTSH